MRGGTKEKDTINPRQPIQWLVVPTKSESFLPDDLLSVSGIVVTKVH